ncbi:MAG: hypothetical protein ACR2KQ_09440 [Actinomycetota bacterium]
MDVPRPVRLLEVKTVVPMHSGTFPVRFSAPEVINLQPDETLS